VTALEEFDAEPPMPVDIATQRVPFDAAVIASRTHQKRPIVPPWMRNRAEARALALWLPRYGAHEVGLQLAHTPLYIARLVARSPRGGWIVGVRHRPVGVGPGAAPACGQMRSGARRRRSTWHCPSCGRSG
jgi:hypothetical protein